MSTANKKIFSKKNRRDWLAWSAVAVLLVFLSLRSNGLVKVAEPAAQHEEVSQEESMEVEIREVAPEEPEPIQEPEPEKQSARVKPETTIDDAADDGEIIPISADYRKHLGFPGYVRTMSRLGGVFYLYDTQAEKIKAETDPRRGSFTDVRMDKLKTMSPRVREISGEVAVYETLTAAASTFGPGRYSVILLLPEMTDRRIQANTIQAIRRNGMNPAGIERLVGEYHIQGGVPVLRIIKVARSSGRFERTKFDIKM